jgi:hypothetical protein
MMAKQTISETELIEAFANTHFGHANHRDLLNKSVLKVAMAYHCGSTITRIMTDLNLIGKNYTLKKRGIALLREVFGNLTLDAG